MKVNSQGSFMNFSQLSTEKTGERDGNGSEAYSQQQKKQDSQKDQTARAEMAAEEAQIETIDVTDESVKDAMNAFGSDLHAQMSGITASQDGTGPGLKVILKDGTGSVVRQFSGEEFLKLREQIQKEGRKNGKILDQKI
jgi:uncharacterized protein YlxW (UPF0749 family)